MMRKDSFAPSASAWSWGILLLAAFASACAPSREENSTESATPAAIAHAECGVCGMTVADQPAPRGQVMHRNGDRRFFCSLGDMRAYVQAPSPLGEPVRIWVETLPGDVDPEVMDVTPRSWIDAEQAVFVVGIARPGIMGRPVFAFADEASAAGLAKRPSARITTWNKLAHTPFNDLP